MIPQQNRIAGCSFSIYPMSGHFVEIILSAIRRVDMSKVWHQTNDIETCVRGRISHVFDVTLALFSAAIESGEHVVFRGTFSIGCPGDSAADSFMANDDEKLNKTLWANSSHNAMAIAGKFSVYPLGMELGVELNQTGSCNDSSCDGYMGKIYECIEHMRASSLKVQQTHYATRFDGDLQLSWQYLEQCFQMLEEQGSRHTVMDVTISANSPTGRANQS